MNLAHQIRLKPTPRQEAYFRRACGTARFTWNWALAKWIELYKAGEKPNGRALRKVFNSVREAEYPWSYDVHRDCTSRPFDNLQDAFQNFFRRVSAGEKPGHPRFKKKGKTSDSFYIANDQFRFEGDKVRLPKIGWVKMCEVPRFSGKILGASVSRKADQWHIAIQLDVGEVHKQRTGNEPVGVDLGIKASAVLSTGKTFDGPKALRTNLSKLQRLSRQHSRKKLGSNNRRKSTVRLARLHLRIGNIRKDYLHKLSTYLCKNHAAVGIEDLNVGGLVRNHKLARSISDEGWSELRRQLSYKAPMYGAKVVVHDRWYPSSKTCSRCGFIKDKLPLSCRTYECGACGRAIDRDLNAALNLTPRKLPEGTWERKACGAGKAKAPVMKQESSSYPLETGTA